MRRWLTVVLAGLAVCAAEEAVAQDQVAGRAHFTVGSVLMLDRLPSTSSQEQVGAWQEEEGAVLLRVRSNGPWRLEGLSLGTAADGQELWWRARVEAGSAEVAAEYVEVGTGSVVASSRAGGEVVVRIDYRWRTGEPGPDTDLTYTLASLQ